VSEIDTGRLNWSPSMAGIGCLLAQTLSGRQSLVSIVRYLRRKAWRLMCFQVRCQADALRAVTAAKNVAPPGFMRKIPGDGLFETALERALAVTVLGRLGRAHRP
jgi:hypothetical protein